MESFFLFGLYVAIRAGILTIALVLLLFVTILMANHEADGDVIIRYAKGSFVVIRCKEEVAHKLFFIQGSFEYAVTIAMQTAQYRSMEPFSSLWASLRSSMLIIGCREPTVSLTLL